MLRVQRLVHTTRTTTRLCLRPTHLKTPSPPFGRGGPCTGFGAPWPVRGLRTGSGVAPLGLHPTPAPPLTPTTPHATTCIVHVYDDKA